MADNPDIQDESPKLVRPLSKLRDMMEANEDAIREAAVGLTEASEDEDEVGVYIKSNTQSNMKSLPYEAKRGGTVKEVDASTRTVMGYYASFGNVDSDRDVFQPGAFQETIEKRGPDGSNRIRHLWQHNPEQPIGVPRVLREDSNGLYFETKIVDTTAGTDALKLYEAGVINEHSVGFNRIDSEPRDDGSTLITRVKLWEGSSVTWGANSQTPFVGMKGLSSRDDLVQKLNAMRQVLRKGLSDTTAEQIEIGLRQVEAALRAEEEEKQETIDLTAALKGGFWPQFSDPTPTSHDTTFFPSTN